MLPRYRLLDFGGFGSHAECEKASEASRSTLGILENNDIAVVEDRCVDGLVRCRGRRNARHGVATVVSTKIERRKAVLLIKSKYRGMQIYTS